MRRNGWMRMQCMRGKWRRSLKDTGNLEVVGVLSLVPINGTTCYFLLFKSAL